MLKKIQSSDAPKLSTPELSALRFNHPIKVDNTSVSSFILTRFGDGAITSDGVSYVKTKTTPNLSGLRNRISKIFNIPVANVKFIEIDLNSEIASKIWNFLGDIDTQYAYYIVNEDGDFIVDQDQKLIKVVIE